MSDAAAITKPAEPSSGPAWVKNFVARAHGEIKQAPAGTPVSYARTGGSTLLDFTEGGITGSLLGATHARWGLDSPVGPVDAWIAGFSALIGVAASGHYPGVAEHFRKVGTQAFTILAFRKSYEVVKHEPLMGGSGGVQRISAPGKGPGVSTEDPIEAAAKRLEETR